MIIQVAHLGPFILAPIAFGLLTIFGRKGKKEEKEGGGKPDKTPPPQHPVQELPSSPSPLPSTPPPENTEFNPESSSTPEETSLNKLLQSLLQDMPFTPTSADESGEAPSTSTPEWVPPRSTPPSRPMVLVPGGKGERVFAHVEPDEPAAVSTKPLKTPEPEARPPLQAARPSAPPPQKVEPADQDPKKPSKPEKLDRPDTKQQSSGTSPKGPQNFERIFELTQGALKTPGLVIINGPAGSGKTSLSSNLAGAYLKTGSPCLLVTYDQSVSSLRDKIKQTGWDPTKSESEFHLLIVDGFATQSDSFSFETYCIEKPFDMDNFSETLVRNSQVFMSSKVQIILDSLTGLATRIPQKEFLGKFRDLLNKMKESGATFVATLDESKLSKDITGPLEDLAACVIDLQKEGDNSGRLKVRKLNGSISKSEPEGFEIEPGKGLLFV